MQKHGNTFEVGSIINSRFDGKIFAVTKTGSHAAIIPQIIGRTWITGTHPYMLGPDDPWPQGYRLKDTWGFGLSSPECCSRWQTTRT